MKYTITHMPKPRRSLLRPEVITAIYAAAGSLTFVIAATLYCLRKSH